LHWRLARVIEELDPERALEAARAACRVDPVIPFPHSHLGALLMRSEELDEAETALRQALDLAPDDAHARHRLSELRQRQGRTAEAIAESRRAVELDPDLAHAWIHLGHLLSEAGSLDEAEAALRRAVSLAPGEALGHLRIGQTLRRRGDVGTASASIRRAAELAGPDSWVWSDVGVELTEIGALDEAKAALERAITADGDEPVHHFRLGQVQRLLGNRSAALALFRRAAELGPGEAWILSHLGHVLTEAGHFEEARAALQRAVALAPDDALSQVRVADLIERRERAARRARRDQAVSRAGRALPLNACVVLAAPRTGSTVLGKAASAAWDTDLHGEIFLDKPEGDNSASHFYDGNFFQFRRSLLERNSALSVPTYENQRSIFDSYCGYLTSMSECGASLLDIKYYSWHHLNVCFVLPHEPPTLIDFVREANWPVVHLVRENLFALYCSVKLGETTKTWHQNKGGPTAGDRPSLRIDVRACRLEMDRIKAATGLFNRWFEDYDNFHHLTYERLFSGEAFSPEVTMTLTRMFDEPPVRPLIPPLQKVNPRLRNLVENGEEVLRAFEGTSYYSMISEALA
jgi:Flp pilus assembly protein TadD